MTLVIALQFAVVLAAIWMGARSSGVGLGLWGAVGLLVLVVGFGVTPTSPPIDVMLIILAVIMAASVMDAAGGIDFLVRIAERVIRANPKYVTIVAPLTTWSFTFVAGTGHIVYPLLPVIYETAHQNGIRPERPMAVATIASQQAITASPVSAATAAMIGLFSEKGLTQWGLPQILMICVPATLTGVVVAAIISMFIGKDLKDDLVYQERLAAGEIPAPKPAAERPPLTAAAKLSALIFLIGVAVVAYFSALCDLRFTASQFALISAAASIVGRFLTGTTAGALIDSMGYVNFYLLTTVAALPGVLLFWWMMRAGLVDSAMGTAGIEGEGDARNGDADELNPEPRR